jgi:hypothetical protein
LPTDKAIFRSNPDGLQGRATQYVSKKTVQTAYNGYENGFQTLWEGKAVWTGQGFGKRRAVPIITGGKEYVPRF